MKIKDYLNTLKTTSDCHEALQDIAGSNIDNRLELFEAVIAHKRRLRASEPKRIDWCGSITEALHRIRKSIVHVSEVEVVVEEIMRKRGVRLSRTWRTTVSATLATHCSMMKKYKGGVDCFLNHGRGLWSINHYPPAKGV